jgi:hypothetical protein
MLKRLRTIGSYVQQVDQQIDQSIMSAVSYGSTGSGPLVAGMATYLQSVGSKGPLNFKINFQGQANAGFLGAAGNFAYGAVSAYVFGAGQFGQYMTLSGAGVYAIQNNKGGPGTPFLIFPYSADPSAQNNTPPGVTAQCRAP